MAFEYLEQYSTFPSIEEMDQNVKQHISINRLDLTASERAIVFALAGRSLMFPGASHLKAETIANAVGVSTKTVYRSVKRLVELNIIEKVPQPKLNGIKGASIYKILPFENNVPSNVSQRESAHEISDIKDSTDENKRLSIKSFNLLRSKQAKYNIYNLENDLAKQVENKKAYMNEWQTMLYDFLHSMPFTDQLKDELHKLVLASQVDSVQAFHRAKDVIVKIACDIADGTLTVATTLRAVFMGAYKAKIKRLDKLTCKTLSQVVNEHRERPVPFYDWLNNRDINGTNGTIIGTKPNIENWLDW